MFRRKLLAVASAAVVAAAMTAVPTETVAKNYGMGGCGIGASPSPKLVRQLIASGVNWIFSSSQTSSITSGTSKCSDDGIIKAHYEQKIYVASNMNEIEKATVRGAGEKLEALAFLMGCSENSMATFSKVAHENYETIFAEKNDGSDWVLHRFKETVAANQDLSKTCKKIWL